MYNNDINDIFLIKNNTETIDDKLSRVLAIVRKHLNMDVAFISEFDEGKRVFKFVDAGDSVVPLSAGQSDPLEDTYCKQIVDNRLPGIIPDARKNKITRALEVTERLSIGAYLGIPIVLSNGQVYGTFCCYKETQDDSLNDRDMSFLSAIAEISSNLIEHNIAAESKHRDIADAVKAVIDDNRLSIHYQPIYNLQTNQISGYECLSRFSAEPHRTPDIWFAEAAKVGLGGVLESLAVRNAIKGLDALGDDISLSINASPEYVLDGALSALIEDAHAHRVVIEITEHTPIKDYAAFRRALAPYRDAGVRLAIDDAGAGFSSFQHILELEADIIKLDISLTKSIHDEPKKFLLAKALCAFGRAIGCTITAEGIETEDELKALKELGVDNVQGYLLGRPMPLDEAVAHSVRIP